MSFITVIFKNLLRRSTRSMLTCFGVAIAVCTAISLLGIAYGIAGSTEKSFAGRNVGIVVIKGNTPNQLSSRIPQEVIGKISDLPGVAAADGGLVEMVSFTVDDQAISTLVQGWAPGSYLFEGLKLQQGNWFTDENANEVVLGEQLAMNMKKGVGDEIVIENQPLKIVGVYSSFSVFENGAVLAPLKRFQDLMYMENIVTGVSVVLNEKAMPSGGEKAVCESINNIKNSEGENYGLNALPTREYVNQSDHIKWSKAMSWMTSAIAITVGLLSMLNTMYMAVMERVREISTLRAIGWRRSRVLKMILGESLLISLVGAVIGAIAAYALTNVLGLRAQANQFLESGISWEIYAQGFVMAIVVGLVGGVYPAWQATQLLPSEGLRHE